MKRRLPTLCALYVFELVETPWGGGGGLVSNRSITPCSAHDPEWPTKKKIYNEERFLDRNENKQLTRVMSDTVASYWGIRCEVGSCDWPGLQSPRFRRRRGISSRLQSRNKCKKWQRLHLDAPDLPHRAVASTCWVAFPIGDCALLESSCELPVESCAVSKGGLRPACLSRHPSCQKPMLRLGAGWEWHHPETKRKKMTWKGTVASAIVHIRLAKWHFLLPVHC